MARLGRSGLERPVFCITLHHEAIYGISNDSKLLLVSTRYSGYPRARLLTGFSSSHRRFQSAGVTKIMVDTKDPAAETVWKTIAGGYEEAAVVVVCGQVNGKHINLVGQRRGRRACLLWTALVRFDKEAPACHTERAHRRCPRRSTAKHDITNTIKQARALTTFPAYIHETPLPRRTLSFLCEG